VSFQDQLALGRLGEKLVSRWLRGHGWYVVPSYDFTGSDGSRAPCMANGEQSYVIPDLDVSRDGDRLWLEVKTYAHAAPNRRLGQLVHGIKRKHHEHYLAVQKETGSPAHLGVLEIETGALLTARLDQLTAHACMCSACRSCQPSHCMAPVSDSVYFARDAFAVVHTFSDAEMRELRQAVAA
jgi:hypothetical protein